MRDFKNQKVRDLSGAVESLNRSIKYDKRNIDARNLLGLVYFELGETVMALRQWVVSQNIQTGIECCIKLFETCSR